MTDHIKRSFRELSKPISNHQLHTLKDHHIEKGHSMRNN